MISTNHTIMPGSQIPQCRYSISGESYQPSMAWQPFSQSRFNENSIFHSNDLSSKTTHQLIAIIINKDQLIQKLTETLQNLSQQKPLQQYNYQQSRQVAQQKNNNCFQQRKSYMMKQKIGLMKQVNQRLFGENQQLEKSLTLLSKQIADLREQIKAHESTYSIKMAQMKLQLTEEKKLRKEQAKQIFVLKAIIKELEDELQDEGQKNQDQNQKDNDENHKYSQKQSNKTSVFTKDQGVNLTNSVHHHQPQNERCSSDPRSNFRHFDMTNQSKNEELQESGIVFAQA